MSSKGKGSQTKMSGTVSIPFLLVLFRLKPKQPKPKQKQKQTKKAYFAGGCFWGTEYFLEKAAGTVSVKSGYMGGNKPNPTYQEVCNGKTGHAETVEITFDPSKTSFEKL